GTPTFEGNGGQASRVWLHRRHGSSFNGQVSRRAPLQTDPRDNKKAGSLKLENVIWNSHFVSGLVHPRLSRSAGRSLDRKRRGHNRAGKRIRLAIIRFF